MAHSADEYKNLTKIHASEKIIVYRAVRIRDEKPVILKTLRSDTPKPEHLEALKHEYALLCHLEGLTGVNVAYELISQPNLILVKEDIEAISLKEYLAANPLSVEIFFPIAIQMTDILGEIHKKHVIYHDINPANLIIDPHSGKIQFIDFSLASQLDEETQLEISPSLLEGTLAYIAPERTGRMNRPVDSRSDFYSLGVTFYEMLAGKLPFESADPLELIHDHIAKKPPLLSNVAKSLALVIAKLMAKNPDDRYSSALGIKTDLVKAQKGIEFSPGEGDALDYFHISHKLYGRDEQTQEILESYQRVTQGSIQLCLVSGYSGVGKTSLVREVYKPMTRDKGILISGKFDQLQRNTPYYGFVQAFTGLIHQLLSEPEVDLARMRAEILEALSINGQVLIDVIPELELLIGKQPAVPQLAPQEAQVRFNLTMQNFVHVFAQASHPLIIFLDDLQWADNASLRLFEVFFTDTGLKYLLMIGAYRDNEVDAHHPFSMTVEALEKANVDIHRILLQPLSQQDIAQLLRDSFASRTFEAVDFAKIVDEKTKGNPFFVNEFLKLLYSEKIFAFNYTKLAWEVDFGKIVDLKVSDNVVELMIQKIQKLPPAAIELLKIASCIGHTFDLHTLAVIIEKHSDVVERELWEAFSAGFIKGRDYKKPEVIEAATQENRLCSFAHDRIQQAAYSLISSEKRQQQQVLIGRLLLKEWQEEASPLSLSEIMNHFTEGLSLITEKVEKRKLATFYFQAGKMAKNATAYFAALEDFNAATLLLDPPDWDQEYSFLLELSLEKAECEFFTGRIDDAEQQFQQLLGRARDAYEKAKIAYLMMGMYGSLGKYNLAIKIGLDALGALGVDLPEKPSKLRGYVEIIKIKWLLRNKTAEELYQGLKPLIDPGQLFVSKILSRIVVSANQVSQDLFTLVCLRHLRFCLTLGYSPFSLIALSTGANVFASINDFKSAFMLITFANALIERGATLEAKHQYIHIIGIFFNQYFNRLSSCDLLNDSYRLSLKAGDLYHAAVAVHAKTIFYIFSGIPLAVCEAELKKNLDFRLRIKFPENDDIVIYLSLAFFLQRNIQIPHSDLEKKLEAIKVTYSKTSYTLVLLAFFEACYFSKGPTKAIELGRELYVHYLSNLINIYYVPHFMTLYALSIFECHTTTPSLVTREHWKHIKRINKQMTLWANVYPPNFAHKSLLLQAEMARINQQEKTAIRLYDQAIHSAITNEFTQFVAIINERVGNYFLQLEKPKLAKPYIQEAHHYYLRWGAKIKSQELEAKYPHWLTYAEEISGSVTSTSGAANLDFLSISKATEAISEEIVPERLLTRFVKIVLENAAAERVVIMQNQPLLILAEGTLQTTAALERKIPSADRLPLSVISYVQRSKQTVVLGDATAHPEQFAQDPYFLNNSIKSVLCAPIVYHGNSTGMIYLENNLLSHAFTLEKLKVLQILSSQAAISLENAGQFEHLKTIYKATERFVPKSFLQLLNKEHVEDVKLGDSVKKEITVLFNDIRSFTTLIESRSPEDAFAFVNRYWKFMAPVIRKYHGYIDQYQGDAILAIFSRKPEDGVLASIAMMKELEGFNLMQKELHDIEIGMGIGLSTGFAMLGVIGEEERQVAGLISDVANTAARIEGLNKLYGSRILFSGDTAKALSSRPDVIFRRVDKVRLKGKVAATEIFEIIEWAAKLTDIGLREYLALFNGALENYFAGKFQNAIVGMQKCLRYYPDDKVAAVILERCMHFLEVVLPNWDGTFTMTTK